MSTIARIRVPWSGGHGGPGVSTFFALDPTTALAPLRTFFDSLKAYVVTPIGWTFFGEGDTIVAETGVLSGTWVATGQLGVAAIGGSANHSDATGLCISWRTGTVLFGHRVVGRTFLVPGIKDMYDDGSINPSLIADITTQATVMINAVPGNFGVWTRPFPGSPAWTDVRGVLHPAKAAHAGAFSPITSASVPDLAVVLRSRRD